jgi:hypothetical protein
MDKWGYITADGEFLVEPKFQTAQAFDGEYARADLAFCDAPNPLETGCSVDRKGNVIPIKNLSEFSVFSEGICQISSRPMQGKTGYADARGNVLVQCRYQSGNNFSKGRAIVSALKPGAKGGNIHDYEYVLIDTAGRELRRIGVTGTIATDWSDGLAICRPESTQGDRRYCFVDRAGDVVVRPPERMAEPFTEGLSAFRKADDDKSVYGYMNKSGKIVVAAQFKLATRFSEGLAAVEIEKDHWCYIDQKREQVIDLPPGCTRASAFSHGLAAIEFDGGWEEDEHGALGMKTGTIGYIDRSGDFAIEPLFLSSFRTSHKFSEEGLACVCKLVDDQLLYGYINRTGDYVIQPTYREATEFSSGIAAVQVRTPDIMPKTWHHLKNTESCPGRADALNE